jgi:hypothetical protein
MDSAVLQAFVDELEKIGGGWVQNKLHAIRAHNLVKRLNKGTLRLKKNKKFRTVKTAEVRRTGREHREGTLHIPMNTKQRTLTSPFQQLYEQLLSGKTAQFYGPAVPFSAGEASIPRPLSSAKRKKGDVPSAEDMDALPRREDGRESATTVHGLGQQSSNIGVTCTPTGEHS